MKDLVIQALVGLDKMTYFLDELLALLRLRAGGQHREGTGIVGELMLSSLFCLLFWAQKSRSPKASAANTLNIQ
jgi:hypothetical protein